MCILLFSLPFYQILRNFLSLLRHLMIFFVAHPGARTWCHAFRGGRCTARYPHGPPTVKKIL